MLLNCLIIKAKQRTRMVVYRLNTFYKTKFNVFIVYRTILDLSVNSYELS